MRKILRVVASLFLFGASCLSTPLSVYAGQSATQNSTDSTPTVQSAADTTNKLSSKGATISPESQTKSVSTDSGTVKSNSQSASRASSQPSVARDSARQEITSNFLKSISLNALDAPVADDEGDDVFADIPDDNPPQPDNPSYAEFQLTSITQTSLTVPVVAGARPSYSATQGSIYLPNLTATDLSSLTMSQVTIDPSSPLQQSDLASLTYSGNNFNINLNSNSLMKTNGAGTQLILDITSTDGARTGKAVIGIWRNYITQPLVSLFISQQYNLQFMLNNDANNLTPTTTAISYAIPNFNLYNKATGATIQTVFAGNAIDSRAPNSMDLYVGSGGTPARTTQLDPTDHEMVRLDPNNSNKILIQFDSKILVNGSYYRLRMDMVLMASAAGDSMSVGQQVTNYSADSNGNRIPTPPLWMLRQYDTDLNGNDGVPIMYTDLVKDGPNAGKPKGIYFSNVGQPYRMTFDFSGSYGPAGWSGNHYNALPFTSPTDPGQNTIGHTPDSISWSHDIDPNETTDSAISMLWTPNQIGVINFGQSSSMFGFTAAASDATAPLLRTTMDNLTYNYALDGSSLPALPISGFVQDVDSSQVSVYYTVDHPIDPKTATADATRLLTAVNLTPTDNSTPNWVPFPGSQATVATPAITNQADLTTLAGQSTTGHDIYLYAFDNGSLTNTGAPPLLSNIQIIHVKANIHINVNYQDEAGNVIRDPKTLVGVSGSTYATNDQTYFPTTIITPYHQYTLTALPANVTGSFDTSGTDITLIYHENPGTIGVASMPNLDFGVNNLQDVLGRYIPLKVKTDL